MRERKRKGFPSPFLLSTVVQLGWRGIEGGGRQKQSQGRGCNRGIDAITHILLHPLRKRWSRLRNAKRPAAADGAESNCRREHEGGDFRFGIFCRNFCLCDWLHPGRLARLTYDGAERSGLRHQVIIAQVGDTAGMHMHEVRRRGGAYKELAGLLSVYRAAYFQPGLSHFLLHPRIAFEKNENFLMCF